MADEKTEQTAPSGASSTSSTKKAAFLHSLDDTVDHLDKLYRELDSVEAQQRELAGRNQDIQTHIGALNGLRQAHGLQPIGRPAK